MINILKFFRRNNSADVESKKAEQNSAGPQVKRIDPLDPVERVKSLEPWKVAEEKPILQRTIDDFPIYIQRDLSSAGRSVVMDSKDGETTVKVMDDGVTGKMGTSGLINNSAYGVAPLLADWYVSQGFIGYQMCAIIAQHWLVDKACSQSGEDAVRNGWEIKTEGDKLSDDQIKLVNKNDIAFKLKENLVEFNRFKNIFGIRVAIFQVESDDPDYYEKPFNIDGVTPGSYKGISQIDPYWMTPMLTAQSTADPASMHFYEPEYWVISGKKYHRSHLAISRGPQPADILKPTYIFGGIPLTQRIYERVYAAERTANEAPLLAASKRTTAIFVDVEKAIANESKFVEKIAFWTKFRDNHSVKVMGKDEKLEQSDTNLSDFDSVIMNQFQLVSAIARTPSTKLLGTSPKGFSATGEFEMKSYHEELESIHENTMDPMLERHYLLSLKSLEIEASVQVVWNPVDSMTAAEKADINDKKADTDQKNIAMGAVSPDEVRQRLRDDPHSGYNRLTDDEANEEPGMSPENIADLEKGEGDLDKGEGELNTSTEATPGLPSPPQQAVNKPALSAGEQTANKAQADQQAAPGIAGQIQSVLASIQALKVAITPEGRNIDDSDNTPGIGRTTKPGVKGLKPSTVGAGAIVEAKDEGELPTIKMGGMMLSIENPRGSIRVGKKGDWKIKMPHDYGFINGVKGADGDDVDCFVGKNLKSNRVFVINQNRLDGSFDEHKVMLGFNTASQAKNGYLDSYKSGWKGLGSMKQMNMEEFKQWLKGDLSKPAGE